MIAPMTKITLMASSSDFTKSVHALRALGLLHVKHMQTPQADGIDNAIHHLQTVTRARDILRPFVTEKCVASADEHEVYACAQDIIKASEELSRLRAEEENLNMQAALLAQWNGACESSLGELERSGLFIKIYQGTEDEFETVKEDHQVVVILREKKKVCFAVISRAVQEPLGLETVKLPKHNAHTNEEKLKHVKKDIAKIEHRLQSLCAYAPMFEAYALEMEKKIEFFQVRFGALNSGEFHCLEGFCPNEKMAAFKDAAKQEGWAYLAEDAAGDETAPTLLKKPKWLKAIDPVFDFMGALPGYSEYDVSFWFFLFFSIFFAMLIGDGGYGLIFTAVVLYLNRVKKSLTGPAFLLSLTVSLSTVVWGAITGTWFASQALAQLPVLKALIIPKLDGFVESNQPFVMHLCFVIGAIQLTVAHLMVALRQGKSLQVLGQVGWVCFVWAMLFAADLFVLSFPLPNFFKPLALTGVVLIIFFSDLSRNFFIGALITALNFPLKAIGALADVLSYLRLFVIGYVGAIVAGTVNTMAVDLGKGGALGIVFMLMLLVGGHILNLVLGLMAVLVHGLRLNLLEFSGHMDMQWSGIKYSPFKE